MKRKVLSVLLLTGLVLMTGLAAHAASLGTSITYQGRLNGPGGPANGRYDLTFQVFMAETGGTAHDVPITNSAVLVSNGLFTTVVEFPGRPDYHQDVWMELTVRTNGGGAFTILSPRQPITVTPFAWFADGASNAMVAVRVGDGGVSSNSLQSGAVTAGSVNPSTFNTTFWKTDGNAGTFPFLHFLGTTDDQPLELKANNQRLLRLEPQAGGVGNVVGGFSGNYVASGVLGATIAGGGDAGGWANQITAGNFATIGGGRANLASQTETTIAGGAQNRAYGQNSSIGGGYGNVADALAGTVAGGIGNKVYSQYSFIGGGINNIITNASFSVVAGGQNNTNNSALGVIGGGANNAVGSMGAVVPGGMFNAAMGASSFAAGQQAKANHDGTFVWADNVGVEFNSTRPSQFLIRAANGVGINTNNPQTALHVNGTVTAANYLGNGAGLAGLNATNLAAGTLADARLSANVALLTASQTFTGQNNFKDAGSTNTGSLHVGGYGANGDPKLIYFGDSAFVYLGENRTDDTMELRASQFFFNTGNVGIGLTNPLVRLQVAGTMSATSVGIGTTSPSDSLLDVRGNIRLSSYDLYFREGADRNHGLGWYGAGKLFSGVNIDGPVLYGCDGGGLGSGCSTNLALRWTGDGRVIVDPTGLNAGSLNPGLSFGLSSGEGIASKRTAGGNQFGLDFYINSVARMSIANTGNVGIGTNAPQTALHVVGTVTASAFQGSGVVGWSPAASTSVAMQPNSGYVATNDLSPTVFTLPAAPAIGDVVRVSGGGAGTWRISQNTGQRIRTRNMGGAAGNNWTARGSSRAWTGIAASTDGIKLAACVNGGNIYTSTNSGLGWISRASSQAWSSIASSSDGVKLAACVDGGNIYTSIDSGASWTSRSTTLGWKRISSSADGTKLVACVYGGWIFTSSDSGTNWTARDSNRNWYSVASSADGTKLVAVVFSGQIYTSSNSGTNWTARESNRYWSDVASSADGTKLAACVSDGRMYTSTDSGVTWTPRDVDHAWTCVASSADGTRLVAGSSSWLLYVSTDSGVTWTSRDSIRYWSSAACSADGTKMFVGVNSGYIYASVSETTSGATGYVSGDMDTSIELQFIGNNIWVPLSHEGTILFR